jgi:lauroyl/myristoyl acyltransferase
MEPDDPAAVRVAREVFCHGEQWSVPAHLSYWRRPEQISKFVGEHFIEESLRAKKGLIMLGSHLGPWKYLPWFFQKRGMVPDLFFPIGWPYREDKTVASRTSFLLKAMKILKRNGIIVLMGDTSWGRVENFPFLGADLEFPIGYSVLAQHTGAPVVPMFCVKESHSDHTAMLMPPIWAHDHAGSKEEQVHQMTATYLRHLENIILTYPDNADKDFVGNRLSGVLKNQPRRPEFASPDQPEAPPLVLADAVVDS